MLIDDVVPVIGGGAYAFGILHVWYLRKSTATPVRAVGDSATRARFTSGLIMGIQPTTDGGAYAYSFRGIWRLEADSAVEVSVGQARVAVTATTDSAGNTLGWALYARELNKRRKAEAESEPSEENP
jgi:hypothetical protein